jgi:hypothetical protein
MVRRLADMLRKRILLFKWRQRSRSRSAGTLRIKVSDVPRLLRRLEDGGVPNVVLRWFEEVPRTRSEEESFTRDVDLLVDGAGLELVAELAAQQPGRVRCEIYTDSGRMGTTYGGKPYYPPIFANEILDSRTLYQSSFFVPSDDVYLLSLAYHLVYHKGTNSGIPTGCGIESRAEPKRDYGALVSRLAERVGADVALPVTLIGLHAFLKARGWCMPADCLARWKKKTEWHAWLLAHEMGLLEAWAKRLEHLLVFFVRQDAADRGLTDAIRDMLAEKFTILGVERLSNEQQASVMRHVRGGNWIQHGRTSVIGPSVAVFCYDFSPAPVGDDSQTRRKYPFVENANVFHKHEIRDRLNRIREGDRPILGLHGSDNAYEAQHMLRAVYSPQSEQVNAQFLRAVSGNPKYRADLRKIA